MADPPTAPAREPQQAPAPPQLSPLSGAYLLVILGEPISEEHKAKMMEKLRKGNCRSAASVFGDSVLR